MAPLFAAERALWSTLARAQIRHVAFPRAAIHLAGQVLLRYRRASGSDPPGLPDRRARRGRDRDTLRPAASTAHGQVPRARARDGDERIVVHAYAALDAPAPALADALYA
jgi:hypothetical protein